MIELGGGRRQAQIYCANRRPIQPTAAYPANYLPIQPTAALSSQPPPYPANRHPIQPTAALSSQPPPYPAANCRPIQPR
ncbi:hypothetical protein T484DRAFT_2103977 [Baffinella frigidus]|nr:hypothetical protein T484DRAFT_2103977 [Cryptophyta sp. CCMP2293]